MDQKNPITRGQPGDSMREEISCCLSCGRDTDNRDQFCEACSQNCDVELCPECWQEVCICDDDEGPETWAIRQLLHDQGYDYD